MEVFMYHKEWRLRRTPSYLGIGALPAEKEFPRFEGHFSTTSGHMLLPIMVHNVTLIKKLDCMLSLIKCCTLSSIVSSDRSNCLLPAYRTNRKADSTVSPILNYDA